MRGIMLFEGQEPEPFEFHPAQAPPPVVVRPSNGPLYMAFLLVFAIVLGVLGVVFKEPIANIARKGVIQAQLDREDRQKRMERRAREKDVKTLLDKLPDRLQELRQQVYTLDTKCRSRLGISLAQLYRSSSSKIDKAILSSEGCAQSYRDFCNTCITETDFDDADRVLSRVKGRLAQGGLDDIDRDDLEKLDNWVGFELNTFNGQRILIEKLSENLKQSVY